MVFGGIVKQASSVVRSATKPVKKILDTGIPQAAGTIFLASKAGQTLGPAFSGTNVKPSDGTGLSTMANDNGFFGNFFTDLSRGLGTLGAGLGSFVQGVETVERPLSRFGVQLLPEAQNNLTGGVAADVNRAGGQESSGSGTTTITQGALPVLPSLTGPLLQGAGRILSKPGVSLGLGLGAGEVIDYFSAPSQSKMRITRKMKAEIRRIYMMSGGNAEATAQIYSQLTGVPMTAQGVFMILLKRFRNDGPVVTKAAMRKTKQTLRRMKSMCDMYDDVTKRPAARRAPARRRSSTSVVNVK